MSANNKDNDGPQYQRADLVSSGMDGTATRKALQRLAQELRPIPARSFNAKRLRGAAVACVEQSGAGIPTLERILRIAITGSANAEETPDVYKTMAHLGKTRTMQRIEQAIGQLMVAAST